MSEKTNIFGRLARSGLQAPIPRAEEVTASLKGYGTGGLRTAARPGKQAGQYTSTRWCRRTSKHG